MPYKHEDFVDRADQLADLRALMRREGEAAIGLLPAPEGMGKTWLMEEAAAACAAPGVHVVWLDMAALDAGASYWSISALIAQQLGTKQAHTLHTTRAKISQARALPQRLAADVADITIDAPPVTGSMTITGPVYAETVAQQVVSTTINLTVPRDQEWERTELAGALQHDLVRLASAANVIVFIDNWHVATQDAQLWLRRALLSWIDQQRDRLKVCAVVAGTHVQGINSAIMRVGLPPLSEADILTYWVEKRRLPAGLSDHLLDLLKAKPLYMSIIAGACETRADVGQPVNLGEALQTLLDNPQCILPHLAAAVRAAAIPHQFDEALLSHLQGAATPLAPVLHHLKQWNMVIDVQAATLTFHRDVRQCLIDWWRGVERVGHYRTLNEKALDYYETLLAAQDDTGRVRITAEIIYHRLLTDEARGLGQMIDAFEDACSRYQYDEAEALLKPALEIRDMLEPLTRQWLEYFGLRIALIYGRDDADLQRLRDLCATAADDRPGMDDVLRAAAGWTLGQNAVRNNRWQEGVRHFQHSLTQLPSQAELLHDYDVRILMSLGSAYRDLAEVLGGFPDAWQGVEPAGIRLLRGIEELPYTLYRSLVRRWNFLPNWYFNPDYQTWLIAHLLTEARHHYLRAAHCLEQRTAEPLHNEVHLYLADTDHRLDQWRAARQHYGQIRTSAASGQSFYRRAQVGLYYGRALLAEGRTSDAQRELRATAATFQTCKDWYSLGLAYMLLGRACVAENDAGGAVDHYVSSIAMLGLASDITRRTQAAWELEQLGRRGGITAEQKEKIERTLAGIDRWSYVARFPDRLLARFRRWGLLGALPITYLFVLIVGILFAGITLAIALSGFAGPTVTDTVALVGGAALPIIALWAYPIIYAAVGARMARGVIRRLAPLEEEQPAIISVDAAGIALERGGTAQRLAWQDVQTGLTVDYRWVDRRALGLISHTFIGTPETTFEIQGITAGYQHLQQRLGAFLTSKPVEKRVFDFAPLLLLAAVIALVLAPGVRSIVTVEDIGVVDVPLARHLLTSGGGLYTNTAIQVPLAGFLLAFIVIYWLVLPVVVLWRLIGQRVALQRRFAGMVRTRLLATRALWVIAIVWTLAALVMIALMIGSQVSA